MQYALIIIKPDGVHRRLVGRIINRIEEKGLVIVGQKMMVISKELAEANYSVHKGKVFYEPLIEFMTSGPVVAMVVKGVNVATVARKLIGATFGQDAEPGTIRGDYAISNRFNLIHCSDSEESAKREIGLFFKDDELFDYDTVDLNWVYATAGDEYI